jgi:hypothetical protein
VTIIGLLSSYAWAMPTPDGNQNPTLGQGLYIDAPRGPIVLKDSVLYHNGWHESLPPHARNIFRHNCYVQKTSAPPTVTGTAFIDGASYGIELRPGGVLDGCYWQGNAYAACAFKPRWSVRGSAVLATGGRNWTGSAKQGNAGFTSWADTFSVSDTALVYVTQPPPAHGLEYDTAAFTLSRDYTAHPDWASQSPQMSAAAVTVRGFSQLADYPGKVEPASIPGVTVKAGAAQRPAWVDSAGADLIAGKTTVAQLIAQAKQLAAA